MLKVASKNRRGETGQAMLELIMVFPLVLFLLLALTQVAELFVVGMATNWAARQAARSVAVHISDNPDAVARSVTYRILAPFFPPLPGEASVEMQASMRFLLRSMAYEQGGDAAEWLFGTSLELNSKVVFRDGAVEVSKALERLAAGEGGNAFVRLRLFYPLRVPLVNRFFADGDSEGFTRTMAAEGVFPVMYEDSAQKN